MSAIDPLILRRQARTEWLAGISHRTLLRLEKAGKLTPVRLSLKTVGYRRSELERLLASGDTHRDGSAA